MYLEGFYIPSHTSVHLLKSGDLLEIGPVQVSSPVGAGTAVDKLAGFIPVVMLGSTRGHMLISVWR